jgi:hypothetical protein
MQKFKYVHYLRERMQRDLNLGNEIKIPHFGRKNHSNLRLKVRL